MNKQVTFPLLVTPFHLKCNVHSLSENHFYSSYMNCIKSEIFFFNFVFILMKHVLVWLFTKAYENSVPT